VATFEELDDFLTPDYNHNYWSDSAIDIAREILNELGPSDWQQLEQTWPLRSTSWQVRLADAVYASNQPGALNLLEDLLRSPDVPVALAAANGLAVMDDVWTPDARLRETLVRLRDRAPSGDRDTIEEIIGRISP
jgi:hypothetical protein